MNFVQKVEMSVISICSVLYRKSNEMKFCLCFIRGSQRFQNCDNKYECTMDQELADVAANYFSASFSNHLYSSVSFS